MAHFVILKLWFDGACCQYRKTCTLREDNVQDELSSLDMRNYHNEKHVLLFNCTT